MNRRRALVTLAALIGAPFAPSIARPAHGQVPSALHVYEGPN